MSFTSTAGSRCCVVNLKNEKHGKMQKPCYCQSCCSITSSFKYVTSENRGKHIRLTRPAEGIERVLCEGKREVNKGSASSHVYKMSAMTLYKERKKNSEWGGKEQHQPLTTFAQLWLRALLFAAALNSALSTTTWPKLQYLSDHRVTDASQIDSYHTVHERHRIHGEPGCWTIIAWMK